MALVTPYRLAIVCWPFMVESRGAVQEVQLSCASSEVLRRAGAEEVAVEARVGGDCRERRLRRDSSNEVSAPTWRRDLSRAWVWRSKCKIRSPRSISLLWINTFAKTR
jgi:hypothetical protein